MVQSCQRPEASTFGMVQSCQRPEASTFGMVQSCKRREAPRPQASTCARSSLQTDSRTARDLFCPALHLRQYLHFVTEGGLAFAQQPSARTHHRANILCFHGGDEG